MEFRQNRCRGLCAAAVGMIALALSVTAVPAQTHGPSSYRLAEPWAKMPQGRDIGAVRVIRFTKDGKYVSEFGKTGWAPGEFRGLHAIAVDDDGRIYVGDRGNNRIQLFKPDGTYINTWNQFGKPSGIFIRGKTIYVADSESDNLQNPGFEMGIRIGEIDTGWVHELIVFPWGNPNLTLGTGAEFVTVDRNGNIYGGEPVTRNIQKYFRVRP